MIILCNIAAFDVRYHRIYVSVNHLADFIRFVGTPTCIWYSLQAILQHAAVYLLAFFDFSRGASHTCNTQVKKYKVLLTCFESIACE